MHNHGFQLILAARIWGYLSIFVTIFGLPLYFCEVVAEALASHLHGSKVFVDHSQYKKNRETDRIRDITIWTEATNELCSGVASHVKRHFPQQVETSGICPLNRTYSSDKMRRIYILHIEVLKSFGRSSIPHSSSVDQDLSSETDGEDNAS